MLRWLLLAGCICSSACKIVHSSAGADAGDGTNPSVGFATDSTRVHESIGSVPVILVLNEPAQHTVTVIFETIDSSATSGVDYAVPVDRVTFAPNESTAAIPVSIFSDTVDEVEEDFAIRLISAQGAQLDTSPFDRTQHIVSIVGNQVPRVSFEKNASFSSESVSGPVYVVMNDLTNDLVTVDYLVGGSATIEDYAPLSGRVTFPPGSDSQVIALVKTDDGKDEPNETIVLTMITAETAIVGPVNTHTHTIADNDFPPQVRFTQAMQTLTEGNTGETMVMATLSLSAQSGFAISVPFSVDATSTAVNPADYRIVTPSPVTFAPDQLTAAITVAVAGDTDVEGSETVKLQLGTPTNATLDAPQLHTLTIANDD